MSENELVDRIAAIQGLRPATAERVAAAYPSADQLAAATQDELTEIKGIGAVTAARIVETFATAAPTGEAAEEAAEQAPEAAEVDTTEAATEPATVTAIDAGRSSKDEQEPADDPVAQLKVAAKVVATGAFAVVGTVQEHLPEVKRSVVKAAGAVIDLGREVGRAVFRRAS